MNSFRSSYLLDLNLECRHRVSKVSFVVFESLVPSIETILAFVAMPVCALEGFLSFYRSHNLTIVTTPQHFET